MLIALSLRTLTITMLLAFAVPTLRAGECFNVMAILQNKFLVSRAEAEEIAKKFADKDPAQQEAFVSLTMMLPPVGDRTFTDRLWKSVRISQANSVLKILLNEDTAALRQRVLSNPRRDSTDMKVFSILHHHQWRRRIDLKILRQLTETPPLTVFRDAYDIRAKKLGEHTTVEDFLRTFKIDQYDRLATLAASVKDPPELIKRFEDRLKMLTSESKTRRGFAKLWYSHQAERTQIFINLMKKKLPEYYTDTAKLQTELPTVYAWVINRLEPGWPRIWVKRTSMFVGTMVLASAVAFGWGEAMQAGLGWYRGDFVPKPPDIAELEKRPIEPIDAPTKEQTDTVQGFFGDE